MECLSGSAVDRSRIYEQGMRRGRLARRVGFHEKTRRMASGQATQFPQTRPNMRPIPRPNAGRTHHTAPAQEMTRKIGPSYRSIIADKLARGLDLMSQVFDAVAGGPRGPRASSELDAQALRQFADDAA